MEFKKNDLINETLQKYYETFSYTLDTRDYVPDRYNKKIMKYIYKNMKRKFKQVNKEYKLYVRIEKQEQRRNERFVKQQQRKESKKSLLSRIKQFLHNLFRKKRSEMVKEKADYFLEQKINECDSTSALDNCTSEINSLDTKSE